MALTNVEKKEIEATIKKEIKDFLNATTLKKFEDNIVDKIKYLEANPQVKEEIRSKGKEYILNKFNSNKVGLMWVEFISDLTK